MFAIALLSALSASQAQSLAWQWQTASVRYHAEAMVSMPLGYVLIGTQNLEPRMLKLRVGADLDCEGAPKGKAALVTCAIGSVTVGGAAITGEGEALATVLKEYSDLLAQATLEMDIRADGRIRSVDLEGIGKRGEREAVVHENLRQIARRLVAPLDVQLPKGGVAPEKPWKYKGAPLPFQVMSRYGTSGGMDYRFEVGPPVLNTTFIQGGGTAAVWTGDQLTPSGGATMTLVGVAQYRFDETAGLMAYAEASVDGQATAQASSIGSGRRYSYAGFVAKINADGGREPLGL